MKNGRLGSIIKYWFKILTCENTYNMMLNDIEIQPNKQNLASSVRSLLQLLGFDEMWYFQGFGNIDSFL